MMLPVPESWLVLAIAYFPMMVLAVIWHEAGHALAARLAGIPVAAWGVGIGRPHFSFSVGASRFYFGRPYSSGLTLGMTPLFDASRLRRTALMIAGGPIASIVGLAAGYLLWNFAYKSDVIVAWILISAVIVCVTCIPYRMKQGRMTLASDAWQLIDTARGQRLLAQQLPGTTLANLSALSELLRRIQSDAADYYELLSCIPRAQLGDASAAADVKRIVDKLPGVRFGQAMWIQRLIEALVLVQTGDPGAEAYLAAARADDATPRDLDLLLFALQVESRLGRGAAIAAELQSQLAQARRENRPDRLCMLEILAFQNDPPRNAAEACDALLARHRGYLTELHRVALLAFTAELLAGRSEHADARKYCEAALHSVATVAASVADPQLRDGFVRIACLPLRRAQLIDEERPLLLEPAGDRPQVAGRFSQLAYHLGFACVGLVASFFLGKVTKGGHVPEGLFGGFAGLAFALWICVLLLLLVALVRGEPRRGRAWGGLVIGTVSLIVLASQKPNTGSGRMPPTPHPNVEPMAHDAD